MKPHTIVLVFYFFLLASLSFAEIWVSKQDCDDDTGDGSLTKPFCTVHRALEDVQDDDTITVLSGDYNEIIHVPSTKLTIRGSGTSDPQFKGIDNLPDVGSISLTLERISFVNSIPVLNFTNIEIQTLDIIGCTFQVIPSLDGQYALKIDHVNLENNDVTITFSHCAMEYRKDLLFSIKSPESSHLDLVLLNNRISGSIEVSNLRNANIQNNTFIDGNYNFHMNHTLLNTNTFHSAKIDISNYMFTNMTSNYFNESEILINVDCRTKEQCSSHLEGSKNRFEETDMLFEGDKGLSALKVSKNVTLFHNFFAPARKRGDRLRLESHLTETIVSARRNYMASFTGPYICSNPGGKGILVTHMIDYSYWCLSKDCDSFSLNPPLLNSTIKQPCQTYKGGTIALIAVFSIIFILLAVGGSFALFRFFRASQTNEPDYSKHWIKFIGLAISIFSFLSLWVPIASKASNNYCQTRVPAPDCTFTVSDAHISTILIMIWFFIIFFHIALSVVVNTHYIQLKVYYHSMQALIIFIAFIAGFFIIEGFVFILDYLSSRVMILNIICLAVVLVGDLILFRFYLRLSQQIQEVKLIMNNHGDFSHESLLADQGTEDPRSLQPDGKFVFLFSEYKSLALKNLIVEAITLGIIFPFLIWFTVFYKLIGAFAIIAYICVLMKSGYKIWIVKKSKLLTSLFDYLQGIELVFAIIMCIFVIAYGIIIFISSDANPSVYFLLFFYIIWGVAFTLSFDKLSSLMQSLRKQEHQDRLDRAYGGNGGVISNDHGHGYGGGDYGYGGNDNYGGGNNNYGGGYGGNETQRSSGYGYQDIEGSLVYGSKAPMYGSQQEITTSHETSNNVNDDIVHSEMAHEKHVDQPSTNIEKNHSNEDRPSEYVSITNHPEENSKKDLIE